jgi:hypothetical protein
MRALLAHTLRMVTTGAWSHRSSIKPAWRLRLAAPLSSYAASCFMYTAVGLHAVVLWSVCPEAIPAWPPAIALPEACLVTLQGLWSFASDVLFVGRDSSFHAVDRVSALSLTALQLAKFGWVLPATLSSSELSIVWFGICLGLACKVQGYRAILGDSVDAFRLWHTLWHVTLPGGAFALHVLRWRACEACGSAAAAQR